MKPWCVIIQIKAIEQYFHVVLVTVLYKVVAPFKSLDGKKNSLWPFKLKLLSSIFMWHCLLCFTRTVLTVQYADHETSCYWVAFSCGSVYLFIYYLCCMRLISLLTMHRKPWCVTTQMKAIEQYFLVVLFIFPYKTLMSRAGLFESRLGLNVDWSIIFFFFKNVFHLKRLV